jgi:cytosine/adenosine deaminase-related metal-dependent hydrolase
MPGLINTHNHTPMTIVRGYRDDLALNEWLESHMWPWEHEHINPDTVAAGSRLAIAEMVRAGITTFNDMYFYAMSTALAAREAGVRALVAEAYAEGGPHDFDYTLAGTAELVSSFASDRSLKHSQISHPASFS